MSSIKLKDPIKFIVSKVKECVEEACDETYTTPSSWGDEQPHLVVSEGKPKLVEKIIGLVEERLRNELDVE